MSPRHTLLEKAKIFQSLQLQEKKKKRQYSKVKKLMVYYLAVGGNVFQNI